MTNPKPIVAPLVLALVLAACSGSSSSLECDEPLPPQVRPGICLDDPEERPVASTEPAPVLGDEGTEAGLADHAGQVVVVNFWASWCGPCRREQPALNDLHDEFADRGVAFLGVNVQDSEANALAHVEEFSIPYPSIFDQSAAWSAGFGGGAPQFMPSTVVVDQQGRMAVNIAGETTGPELAALIEALLAEQPPDA